MQQRSRERFERVLRATADLIEHSGFEPITMTDIANQADMQLTALYRYFPNKRAVLRELALATFEDARSIIDAPRPAELTVEEALDRGIRDYWQRHVDEPFRIQLRALIHADAELAALNLADSKDNAAVIAKRAAELTGRTDVLELERESLLMIELLHSLIRLTAQVPKAEAELLVAAFVRTFATSLSKQQP